MRPLLGSRLARLMTTSLVLAVTFAAGAAFVAIGAEDSPVYFGCVARAGGSLYQVDTAPANCRYGDRQISWNQEGTQGLQGAPGPQGIQGEPGKDGATGAPGETGQDGEDGEAGVVWRDEFDPSATYAVGDAVLYEGSAYIAITAPPTGTPDTSDDWDLLAAKGEQGEQGLPGVAGKDGEKGAPGLNGETGETGPRGPSDGWVIARGYQDDVIIDGEDITVVSATLPAGNFLLQGHATILNTSGDATTHGVCYLSGDTRLGIPYDLGPNARVTIPLTASHSTSSSWIFAIRCSSEEEGGVVIGSFANAIQVETLH